MEEYLVGWYLAGLGIGVGMIAISVFPKKKDFSMAVFGIALTFYAGANLVVSI